MDASGVAINDYWVLSIALIFHSGRADICILVLRGLCGKRGLDLRSIVPLSKVMLLELLKLLTQLPDALHS